MPAFKDEKRGTWFTQFYYVDWTKTKKLKKKRGFKTKREALEWEQAFLEQETRESGLSFGALIDNYMQDMKTRLRPTSINNKEKVIRLKILPYFKNQPLNKITPSNIRAWQSEMLKLINPHTGKPYSPTYIRHIHVQLSSIFNYAVKYYDLARNPCQVAGVMGSHKANAMKIWTIEEFEQFSAKLKKGELRLMFEILFWTGIRSGELLALTSEDILDGRIRVNKTFTDVGGVYAINPPKTPKGNREVTIPDFLNEKIKDYIKTDPRIISPQERIFPYTRAKLYKAIRIYAVKAGVKQIRAHDLRHSHASLLIEKGYNVVLIAERLGHENVETTLNTYAHLYPNKHEELAKDLDEMKGSFQ